MENLCECNCCTIVQLIIIYSYILFKFLLPKYGIGFITLFILLRFVRQILCHYIKTLHSVMI